MPSKKLLETLSCFSAAERKRLRLFVQSPYDNDRFNPEKILELLDLIEQHKLDPEAEALDKKRLNQHFFPERSFQEKAKNPIDSLTSDLFALVRRFILLEDAQDRWNKGSEYLAMARFYRRNNLETRFRQVISQYRRFQEKHPYRDADFFLQLFRVEEEIATFETYFNTYTGDPNLVAVHTALDNFYAVVKLEIACILRFQQLQMQMETGEAFQLSDALLAQFDQLETIHSPLVVIYEKLHSLLQRDGGQLLLEEYHEELIKSEQNIPKITYRNLMAYYRFFIGLRYTKELEGTNLLESMFSLYQEHLKKGYFEVEDEKILPDSLKLIINIAIKLKEYSWARSLLKRYPPKRIAGTRFPGESHQLCLAEISFAEGAYEEAHKLLEYRKFENLHYSILSDVLLIKIYFVTGNDLIESRVHALEQKIRRSKLTPDHRRPYLNFLQVMKRLTKYQWNKEGRRWQQLVEEFPGITPIIEREWLSEMILG